MIHRKRKMKDPKAIDPRWKTNPLNYACLTKLDLADYEIVCMLTVSDSFGQFPLLG